jgi:hypothetical protein
MKTIILYGLRRSGNHFLISTILNQYKNYVHINDTILSYNLYNKYKNIKKYKERNDKNWIGFKDVECILITMENKIIDYNEINKFRNLDNCHFILLLRTPYSNFSSIWKVYNKDKKKLFKLYKLWKLYAKLFIINKNKNMIRVLYDKLSSDKNYIINILKKLGIDNINLENNKVINYQESSFNNINNKRRIYSTIDNCIYKDDQVFLNLVNNKEIKDLNNIILQIMK